MQWPPMPSSYLKILNVIPEFGLLYDVPEEEGHTELPSISLDNGSIEEGCGDSVEFALCQSETVESLDLLPIFDSTIQFFFRC